MNKRQKISGPEAVAIARSAFSTGRTKDINFRIKQLKNLLRMYEENIDEILQALRKDMRKSRLEGYLYEVCYMIYDVRETLKNIHKYSKTRWLRKNWLTFADKGKVEKVPYGVVLVVGPWNYPFQLTLVPVCGAIAAGNCVIIKPSEVSNHTCATIAKLIPKYLDNECYQVVQGGPSETEELLKEKFDYIFFTGSVGTGRKIHLAAARHLTPTTLELGGKSPVYMDDSVDFAMAAQRIIWGKCMNMGQTCVAPDYILCTKEVEDKFIRAVKIAMNVWYGDNWQSQLDFSRVINKNHFNRLKAFLSNSGRVAVGGGHDENDLWIDPTVLVDVKPTDPVMQEEIFGPILAIVRCESPIEAIKFINSRGMTPLCLYVFSNDKDIQELFERNVDSGTLAFNETIVQFAIDELPFGGAGESGMGNYHGKYTFETFSRERSSIIRDYSFLADKLGVFRYPPYNDLKINFLSFLLNHWKKFNITYFDYIPYLLCIFFGMLIMYLLH